MKLGNPTQHFVEIDLNRCNGCVLCMKACPMKAIRVLPDGKAHILGTCVDCGSCVSVCPKRAITSKTSASLEEIRSRYTIVTVSPVFYTQFGDECMPNEVLVALKSLFDQVYDQAYVHELFNVATQIYIEEKRNDPTQKWPIISPICPVVNRLIYYKFPSLLEHMLPFISPREISARELRKKVSEQSLFKPEEIGVYHITPCSAKMISTKSPLLLHHSHLNGVIGINEVYVKVRRLMSQTNDEAIYHYSSGVGIGWAKSGGEIAGIEHAKTLAVSGIKETITYLEKIELGLLRGIEYVEFRACHEGCIGGQLAAVDKYEAKRTTDKLVRMFGIEKRVRYEYVKKLYAAGFFKAEIYPASLMREEISERRDALKRGKEIHSLWELLPQKECGSCGSPDCMSFAEDVIDGLQTPDRCHFLRGKL